MNVENTLGTRNRSVFQGEGRGFLPGAPKEEKMGKKTQFSHIFLWSFRVIFVRANTINFHLFVLDVQVENSNDRKSLDRSMF